MQNKTMQYETERNERWSLAKVGEPVAMETIQKRLCMYYGIMQQAKRYDEQFLNKYDLAKADNSWVKGASDYVIEIGGENILIEIKLKNQKFRKTNGGGITKDKSKIRDYGCESYYLDIDPVYKNMCDFCTHEKINPESFIIFFCGDSFGELRYISLAKINDLVKNGYKGQPLTEYGEGYGINTGTGRAITYLIPEDTTIDISDKNSILKAKNEDCLSRILQRHINMIYGYNSSGYKFYHLDRQCRTLRNKNDESLILFATQEEAKKQGFKKCTFCGEG